MTGHATSPNGRYVRPNVACATLMRLYYYCSRNRSAAQPLSPSRRRRTSTEADYGSINMASYCERCNRRMHPCDAEVSSLCGQCQRKSGTRYSHWTPYGRECVRAWERHAEAARTGGAPRAAGTSETHRSTRPHAAPEAEPPPQRLRPWKLCPLCGERVQELGEETAERIARSRGQYDIDSSQSAFCRRCGMLVEPVPERNPEADKPALAGLLDSTHIQKRRITE